MALVDTSDATGIIGTTFSLDVMASTTLAKLRRHGAASAALLAVASAALLIGRTSVEHEPQPVRSARTRTVPPVEKSKLTQYRDLIILPDPQYCATQHDLVQDSEPENRPTVLQTTAIELESSPSQLGSCEFTDAMPLGTTPDDALQSATTTEAAIEQLPVYHYPMTSVPYADADPAPAATAILEIPAPAPQRPLPGPVNLVVGRDRNAQRATAATVGALSNDGPRENMWSRWTQTWRRKLGEPFSDRKAAHAGDAARELKEQLQTPADRWIPAAASETWYNRRWR